MPLARPRWWTELPLILLVYLAYSGARLLARGDVSTAEDNGLAILRVERALLLNAEEPLNDLFTAHALIGVPSSFLYASLHYLVTPLILVWLFRSHPVRYRLMRTWLLVSTLLGLIGFTLLPTAPPRLLHSGQGFVDSLAQYSAYGWWSDAASAPSGLGDITNQYAAMPSLHVGWALWCGVVLWRYGPPTLLVRSTAAGYPLITTVVVLGTANHYLLDVVAGAAVMGAGLLLSRPALRLVARLRERIPARLRLAAPDGPRGAALPGQRISGDGPGAAGEPAARGRFDAASPQAARARQNGAVLRADGPDGRPSGRVPPVPAQVASGGGSQPREGETS